MMRKATLAIALLIGLNVNPSNAAGGAPKKSTSSQPSPREQALEQFNRGLKHRDKAWKHEKKAAAASKQRDRDKISKRRTRSTARPSSASCLPRRRTRAFTRLSAALDTPIEKPASTPWRSPPTIAVSSWLPITQRPSSIAAKLYWDSTA